MDKRTLNKIEKTTLIWHLNLTFLRIFIGEESLM